MPSSPSRSAMHSFAFANCVRQSDVVARDLRSRLPHPASRRLGHRQLCRPRRPETGHDALLRPDRVRDCGHGAAPDLCPDRRRRAHSGHCCAYDPGLFSGGEIGTNTAYLAEAAPAAKRGSIVSWQGASQYLALIAGGLVGTPSTTVLPSAALEAYGAGVSLLLGAAVVPFGFWLRSRLPETLPVPIEINLPVHRSCRQLALLTVAYSYSRSWCWGRARSPLILAFTS